MATSILGPTVGVQRNQQIVLNPDPNNPVVRDAEDPSSSQNFMRLMIEQLKSQDPMSPMQSAEMTQQLATLNSLEQLVSINSLLSGQNRNAGLSQATGLIGRYVEGMDANQDIVTGIVDKVDMVDGVPVLKVDDKVLLMEQVNVVDDVRPAAGGDLGELLDGLLGSGEEDAGGSDEGAAGSGDSAGTQGDAVSKEVS